MYLHGMHTQENESNIHKISFGRFIKKEPVCASFTKGEEMKYFKQFGVILTVSFLGEVLHAVLPLPVPASIYGLVLMLIALMTGIIPLAKVRDAGNFLIEIMPLMFIPAGVGLMTSWGALKPILVPVIVILVATTILTMGIGGRVTQSIMRSKHKKEEKKS